MFGEDNRYIELAEKLHYRLGFETVLELSDMDEIDVLAFLIRQGLIDPDMTNEELEYGDD